jgi:hypothetical protein
MPLGIAGKTSVHFIPEPAHDHLPEGDILGISFSDHERLPVFFINYYNKYISKCRNFNQKILIDA